MELNDDIFEIISILLHRIEDKENPLTIYYSTLSNLMSSHPDIEFQLADELGTVVTICKEHKVPPLSVLVVRKDSGISGTGLKTALMENGYLPFGTDNIQVEIFAGKKIEEIEKSSFSLWQPLIDWLTEQGHPYHSTK